MNRRTFLGSIGSVGSLAVIGHRAREPVEAVDVRFWLSEQAATYDGVVDRIHEYLAVALDLEFWSVDVSFGGTVSVSTEDGADVTIYGEWPTQVGSGVLGRGSVDPASDVNLLVTDGQMRSAPTGFGVPHIASVGGAKHIAELDPLEEGVETVPALTPERVMHVLVHEVGHAFGLNHDHGVVTERGDSIVASPMLSAYAWDSDYEGERSSCGCIYPETDGKRRHLTYEFSKCARRRLETYRGGILF